MKILVQGTKGGAKIFYPQTTPGEFYTFAGDVRDINGAGGVGEHVYSIAITADGCIFSKYLGVRDVQRSWEGNVSFSLFLSNRQSMPGEIIQALLDELLSTYADRYIVDDNLDIVHEDWSFIEEITSKYESKVKSVSGNELDMAEYGNGVPAFLFYDGNDELRKYFEFPYQKEYLPYKQVFLLDKEEQNNTRNLLNALRHNPDANLTGKVDLENPRLTLTNFDTNGKGGVRITLKANGRYCQNRSKFFRKDDLELTYSKPGYRDKFVTGRLSDPMSAINEYVKIVDGTKVDVRNSVDLDPEIIDITLRITDETGNAFDPANGNVNIRVYQSKDYSSGKEILSLKVTFIGEETLKWWMVEASSDNKKGHEEFKPSNIGNGEAIEIIMKENKPIEIERKADTTDRGQGNMPHMSKKYYIYVDPEKGASYFPSEKETSSEPSYSCTPKKGYKFVKWNLVDEKKKVGNTTYPGYCEAVFKELWWHKIPGGRLTLTIAAAILLAGMISLVCWWYLNASEKNDQYYDIAVRIDKVLDEYEQQPESVSLEDLKTLQGDWKQLMPDSTKKQELYREWQHKTVELQTIIDELERSNEAAAAVEQHKIDADSEWEKIKDSKDKADFDDYLNKLNGWGVDNHKEDANAALRDINDWETAKSTNTKQAYTSYLNNHPDGRFRQKANQLKNSISEPSTSTSTTTTTTTTTTPNSTSSLKISHAKLKNDFWNNVKDKQPKTVFDGLIRSWESSYKTTEEREEFKQYKTFYNKYICYTKTENGHYSNEFFYKIPDSKRKSAATNKNLNELERLVEEQINK